MNILGIESSCDETSAAVVADGCHVRSNVVASQVDVHAAFGGVVPEVAARQHVLWITPVIERALQEAGLDWSAIDAVAVTRGPGLAGALLVGVNAAKAIAFARDLPLVGVNHIEGHLYSAWLVDSPPGPAEPVGSAPGNGAAPTNAQPPEPRLPVLALVVSGAHSDLILMRDHGVYDRLGRTRDDAAGEAFDKVARILGLGYPGGPVIQRAAEAGDPRRQPFPRAQAEGYDFSFSGLKTAVLRAVERLASGRPDMPDSELWTSSLKPSQLDLTPEQRARLPVADLAAGFQAAVVRQLIDKTRLAAEAHPEASLVLCGGVAANRPLREAMTALAAELGRALHIPPLKYCTDNAAMIAACGYFRLMGGDRAGFDLDVAPNLKLVGAT